MLENQASPSLDHGVRPAYRHKPSALVRTLYELLDKADIRVGGDRPHDIHIHDAETLARRVFAQANLGLGEAYMDGIWEANQLDAFFTRLLQARLQDQVQPARMLLHALRVRLFNLQSLTRAWTVGEKHYDIGNDFYEAMLDRRMTYTCGYWGEGALTLDQAQEAKLDLICRKLGLEPGMRLLDIGCGWGSLMGYAAERYGVECVGITISREQAALGAARYRGLPVEFRLQDYRDLDERFDRIASVGMFEHVGRKNHRIYMEVAHRCLEPGGLFLLHTIGKNQRHSTPDPWVDKYIFPNGDLPSVGQVGDACDGLFVIEDLHNFGADYDRTLMAWYRNFQLSWPRFEASMGERFRRMWEYYLLSCAGAFRARDIQLWQWVLAREGVPGGYFRPTLSSNS